MHEDTKPSSSIMAISLQKQSMRWSRKRGYILCLNLVEVEIRKGPVMTYSIVALVNFNIRIY